MTSLRVSGGVAFVCRSADGCGSIGGFGDARRSARHDGVPEVRREEGRAMLFMAALSVPPRVPALRALDESAYGKEEGSMTQQPTITVKELVRLACLARDALEALHTPAADAAVARINPVMARLILKGTPEDIRKCTMHLLVECHNHGAVMTPETREFINLMDLQNTGPLTPEAREAFRRIGAKGI